MPVRPRRSRQPRNALTPSRVMALSIGPSPLEAEDDDVLCEVWTEHRVRLLDDHPPSPRGPWGHWRFDVGIPDDLRGERARLYPPEEAEEVRREQAALEARRVAWLAAHHDERRQA